MMIANPFLTHKSIINSFETKLFDEKQFYKAFSNDFKRAQRTVIIESPYITTRRAKEFSVLCSKLVDRGVRIAVYTRNPHHHDGVLIRESMQGIKVLKDVGVKVVECSDMRHRKLAIIDDSVLWEGSLNMLSQNGSREIMRRTVSEALCKQMRQFLGLKWYSKG